MAFGMLERRSVPLTWAYHSVGNCGRRYPESYPGSCPPTHDRRVCKSCLNTSVHHLCQQEGAIGIAYYSADHQFVLVYGRRERAL